GHGRGIMEAMACAKPVVVLGERGEGELINEGSVENIAYTNFSGRHFRGRRERIKPLSDLLGELFNDEEALARLGRFSHDYILSEQDARRGAEQLTQVYKWALRSPARLTDFCVWITSVFVVAAWGSLRWRLRRWRGKEDLPARAHRYT
ncbi:MAG: hypothetical protein V3U86_10460, partial [Acidobacteriota bacterium]